MAIKFSSLRDFLAVAERGSLRGAARQLGSAQPAISRSIQELERELGAVLFERLPTGVHLTSMGKVFLRRASTVRNERRLAQEELDQLQGETHGQLTVAMSSVPHMALLPNALRPFRARYPNVSIEIIDRVYPTIELDLKESRIDCYFGPAPDGIATELSVEKMFDNTRVIVGRKGHPLAQHELTLDAFCGAHDLLVSFSGRRRGYVDQALAALGRQRRIVLTVNQFFTAWRVVQQSDLLTVLPETFMGTTGYGPKLVLRELPMSLNPVHVEMIWHLRHDADPAHRWLRDQMLAAPHAGDTPAAA